ncbi:Fibulin-7 [Triplophysa tibetana]|uniref:Fibulin-7 n=1 Tax=Triplophysa tibetana TaxID=1572043 RepID=A0A5A9PRD7_9TELE|nr:Fibulin-7 [Triplophysa tibetana]
MESRINDSSLKDGWHTERLNGLPASYILTLSQCWQHVERNGTWQQRGHNDCWCGQELQNTLRQVQKLLSSHQTSFQQSLRSVHKKLSLLQNNTVKQSKLNTGKQSTIRDGTEYNNASVAASASSSSYSSQPPNTTRPSRCIEFLGSSHCTCEQGYSISRLDTKLCTDLDECELYRRTQPGRLCLHTCVNTAGSFFCQCPSGYSLARDSRSCHDIDECVRGAHNCSRGQVCVNTHGGHRCVEVECPRFRNATYMKTSALRCDRNPCLQEDKACLQAPLSVNFHFMSVVSNMTAPTVLFRLSAARVLGDTLRFGLMGNRGVQYFTIQRSGRQTGQLVLINSVQGPATLQANIEMSELEKKVLLGRYVTKVTLFVSPYNF